MAAGCAGVDRLDAARGHDNVALVACGFGQLVGPGLKVQPVGDKQLGVEKGLGVGGSGFKHMRILVGPHQGGDSHPVAADDTHQVTEDAEAGRDGDFVVGIGGAILHQCQDQAAGQEEAPGVCSW